MSIKNDQVVHRQSTNSQITRHGKEYEINTGIVVLLNQVASPATWSTNGQEENPIQIHLGSTSASLRSG